MDRVVYILYSEGTALTCVVRTTKLMKWEKFSEAEISSLKTLFGPKYTPFVQLEDRRILLGLMQLTKRDGDLPSLDGEYGHDVFTRMLDSGRLFFSAGSHLRLKRGEPIAATLSWTALPDNQWRPSLTAQRGIAVFALNPPVYIDGTHNTCGDITLDQPSGLAASWLAADSMDEADTTRFCLRLAKRFPEAKFPTPPYVQLNEVAPTRPRALLRIEQRSVVNRHDQQARWVDLTDRLRLRLRFGYGDAIVAWDATEPTASYRSGDNIVRMTRDPAAEAATIDQLAQWGFTADRTTAESGFFNFDSSVFSLAPHRAWREHLLTTFPALSPDTWQVEHIAGLRVSLAQETDAYTHAQDQGGQAFLVDFGVNIDGHEIPLLPLLHRALRQQKSRAPAAIASWLSAGDFAFRIETAENDPIRFHWVSLPSSLLTRVTDHLHELFDANPFDPSGRTRLNQWRVGELVASGVLQRETDDGLREIVRLCQRLGDGIKVSPRLAPTRLRATLRPYQESGLGWLHTLGEVAAGGILADDMGLGKTVQTIAHLLELHAAGQLGQGVLLVAPTSVITNWEAELQRFAPDLVVATYHGHDRESIWRELPRLDVLITTYALLWRDSAVFMTHTWDLVVLDEAQFIKNADSRTSQAARTLNAKRRLCLTGTPIENRLQDIWALFEFLLPGFLGDELVFKNRIAKPLTDDDAQFATILRDRLRQRLAPFVLRRLKAEVLPDLPEKTEIVHAVSMTPRQADLYATLRQEIKQGLKQSAPKHGGGTSRVQILAHLLKLRQICCDPRLLDKDRAVPDRLHDSAKLTALLELLDQLHAQGSRTLVFSQFTSMLDLIAASLREQGRDYLMLTGSTQNRAELVNRFQAGECPLFLISLRAGGSGLNLTAADSVIHYDPWWNPAVERQATDRTHRIGQKKPVFVYKLIVDDSIESKIQELQRTKLELVEGLLSEGDIDRVQLDQSTIDYLLSD